MTSILRSKLSIVAFSAALMIVGSTAIGQSVRDTTEATHISRPHADQKPRTIAGITWQPSLEKLIAAPKKDAKPVFLLRVLGDLEGDL